MVGRCTGLCKGCEVFVCMSRFLRLNVYHVLPAALDQNNQPECAGRAPYTWQNKMGPQHDSDYNIPTNK